MLKSDPKRCITMLLYRNVQEVNKAYATYQKEPPEVFAADTRADMIVQAPDPDMPALVKAFSFHAIMILAQTHHVLLSCDSYFDSPKVIV